MMASSLTSGFHDEEIDVSKVTGKKEKKAVEAISSPRDDMVSTPSSDEQEPVKPFIRK